MAQTPSMQRWTKAWHQADPEVFMQVYAPEAAIFPPNKPTVKGNQAILDFMRGGLGKVDVFFEPEHSVIADSLAFEFGVFKDKTRDTGEVVGKGKYAITWIQTPEGRKVLSHSWSMPERG